jgi:hypothetical protein
MSNRQQQTGASTRLKRETHLGRAEDGVEVVDRRQEDVETTVLLLGVEAEAGQSPEQSRSVFDEQLGG